MQSLIDSLGRKLTIIRFILFQSYVLHTSFLSSSSLSCDFSFLPPFLLSFSFRLSPLVCVSVLPRS